MASKFQNRLVGTVVLVALVVIVLPAILDGQKKHYQDDFAAIPLVPKPGDSPQTPALPPASQPLALPTQPPEGAGEEVKAANASVPSLDTVRQAANQGQGLTHNRPAQVSAPPLSSADKPAATSQTGKTASQPADEQDEILALLQQRQQVAQQTSARSDNPPPEGRAYVVQLGALKNADKVNEIVDKLRAAGYRVYTIPATPVADKITRILVGPDTNKDKLTAALDDLRRLSGLSGVVRNYSVAE